MRRPRLAVIAITALAAAACASPAAVDAGGAPAAPTAGSYTPVDLENCGRSLHFDAPPSRVMLPYHPMAEMFVGLGLADRAIGRTGYSGAWAPDPPILPEMEADFARIPVVSDTAYPPPREQLLALRPDFLFLYGDFDLGGEGAGADGLATLEDLERAGVQVYLTTCPDPTGNYGGENLEATFRTFEDLGRIFGVEDRGAGAGGGRCARDRGRAEPGRGRAAGRHRDVRRRYRPDRPVRRHRHQRRDPGGGRRRNLFPDGGLYFQASLEAVAATAPQAWWIFANAARPDGTLDPTTATDFLFPTFPQRPPPRTSGSW
ncbi:hypothetical protein BJF78_13510 [Pseudonocardia sp. CNS-139]|nr:hypothetical protein BJF78_13510 [Pseudonocardia sp. CNS-139]